MNRSRAWLASASLLLLTSCATAGDSDSGATNVDAGGGSTQGGADAAGGPSLDGGSGGDAEAGTPGPTVISNDPSIPITHNSSGAPDAHVIDLVKTAIASLGFAGNEGPVHEDRFFVGQHYMAWIDQTGFYGKMNGLWVLNGQAGALDFSLRDGDGRPINALIPGEDGEGHFAPGYKGGEHAEFPNRTPEPNDDPACATRDWCNQYGINEAPPITNPKIPWWSACNAGRASFDEKHDPVVMQPTANGGLKLVYEASLVKEADGDGTYDGDACHQDYLFPDGVRRKVLLHVGYELYADKEYVDRTQQIVNPAGNPNFDGPMSLIGGFVMTEWPNPNYVKRWNRYWRPESSSVNLNWDGTNVSLAAQTWNPLSSYGVNSRDVLIAWADQALTLSSTSDFAAARTATVQNVGPSDNKDLGSCLCVVHGAIEMGGGLIHNNTPGSLPVPAGQSSIEARRRLTLPSSKALGSIVGKTYDVKTMGHIVGRAEVDGWSAATGSDKAGDMIYGPYATDWGQGGAQAVLMVMVDNNSADDLVVATIDVNDFDANTIIASRDLHRKEFHNPMQFQRFTLNADLTGRAGHKMEARVHWKGVSYVKVGKVSVNVSDL